MKRILYLSLCIAPSMFAMQPENKTTIKYFYNPSSPTILLPGYPLTSVAVSLAAYGTYKGVEYMIEKNRSRNQKCTCDHS